MSVETTTQAHSAIGVTPAAPLRIKGLTVLPDYRLALTFNDGSQGIADLPTLRTAKHCGVFEALKDPDVFAQARLEFGVVTWPIWRRPRSGMASRRTGEVGNVVCPF